MSYRKNHSEREFLFEETKDISSSSTFKSSPLKDDKYFILHHTAGRGTAMDVMNVLNTRHLGVQWTRCLGVGMRVLVIRHLARSDAQGAAHLALTWAGECAAHGGLECGMVAGHCDRWKWSHHTACQ